jgi:hypothetical protein
LKKREKYREMEENYIEEQEKQSHNDISITNIRKKVNQKSIKSHSL